MAITETILNSKINGKSVKVQEVIDTVFEQADARNWDGVKAVMADSVYTDYTSLGSDIGFKTPDEILTGWKTLLPGSECTFNQIHNEAIWCTDLRATATLDVIAAHFLDGEQWTVFIGYETEFRKEKNSWKMARIDAYLYQQVGNTAIFEKATENEI